MIQKGFESLLKRLEKTRELCSNMGKPRKQGQKTRESD